MSQVMRKRVLCNMRTTKVQISLRSLISNFVVRYLGSICILAVSNVSRFQLASVTMQAGSNLT